MLKRRKDFCKLNLEDLELPALEDRYTGAIEEWESFKKDAIEKKEQDLLALYPVEIAGDSECAIKQQKKAV